MIKQHIPQKPWKLPGLFAVSTCIPDTCPRSWSCCHGISYKAPASSLHPRTASHPLCAARYGQPLPLSRTAPAPCTSHTADAFSEKVSSLSATCCHTRARMHPHGPPCAVPHTLQNLTVLRKEKGLQITFRFPSQGESKSYLCYFFYNLTLL